MIRDPNKGITIQYNHLDLPISIAFDDGKKIEMLYDATGTLLSKKQINSSSTVIETRDYIAGTEYVNAAIESIYHSEGRVFYNNGTPRYEYILKDHLGNSRVVYYENNGSLEVLAELHYYPHGMKMNGPWASVPTNAISYQYNGIDYVDDFGLNVNMATFRTLDPATGRWWSADPKAELYLEMSPYCAMGGSPLMYNDPDGDALPFIAAAAIIGGTINLASNWSNVSSLTEGLSYFATGATGYAVGVVNPVAGGLILAGGNLSIRAINGDLPQVNSVGDFAITTVGVGLDFLGPYTMGTAASTSWTKFQPTGQLSQAEIVQLSKEGITPSIKEIAGTGLRKTTTEQVIKNTVVQTTNTTKTIVSQVGKNGWLQFHEGIGHTIARHVGKTDAQLINRLANSRRISGASTFTNQTTAEATISSTIKANRATLNTWLRSGSTRNLRLDYTGENIIGRGIMRGQSTVSNLTNARVILKPTGNGGFNILTAFPK